MVEWLPPSNKVIIGNIRTMVFCFQENETTPGQWWSLSGWRNGIGSLSMQGIDCWCSKQTTTYYKVWAEPPTSLVSMTGKVKALCFSVTFRKFSLRWDSRITCATKLWAEQTTTELLKGTVKGIQQRRRGNWFLSVKTLSISLTDTFT